MSFRAASVVPSQGCARESLLETVAQDNSMQCCAAKPRSARRSRTMVRQSAHLIRISRSGKVHSWRSGQDCCSEPRLIEIPTLRWACLDHLQLCQL